jgi:hypothetical protein
LLSENLLENIKEQIKNPEKTNLPVAEKGFRVGNFKN